jgi:copper chaperone CopZ
MEELRLSLPALWADHHVLKVRDVLKGIGGVDALQASAMDHNVQLSYDPAQTSPDAIATALTEAGYAPGDVTPDEMPPTNKPSWLAGGIRTTTTDPADLAMSGDHRKY